MPESLIMNQQKKSLRKCSFPVVEQSTSKKYSEIVPTDVYSLTLFSVLIHAPKNEKSKDYCRPDHNNVYGLFITTRVPLI